MELHRIVVFDNFVGYVHKSRIIFISLRKMSAARQKIGGYILVTILGVGSALYTKWDTIIEGETRIAKEREAAKNKTK